MTGGAVWAVAGKDLRAEARSKYALGSVLPFAATMLLAFGFALGPDRVLLERAAPGLLWLAALFAAVDLFHRSYQAEADAGALDGLVLAPLHKGDIFLGKAIAAAVQVLVLVLGTGLIVTVLFGLELARAPLLLLTAVLGVAGLSALGSLFGLLTVLGRRQAALPVLLLPLVTPVLIAAIRATATLVEGTAGVAGWLGVLAAFDAMFLAAGYLVFGHLLED
ncbi:MULTISPECIES: heme exporter protein CcmB [unclassified Nocardioides]|uniref:heme exporter protein CcmB n=1 Tax=unclassified Nocardioides TaxID=2615069 RepID=UPI000056FE38|nr:MULTISPECIES: heme exporter protein CcmB [unclassified Nocardioides]ABL81463.1 cytochrome c-type biogenesis protein CcmB [Nocardioides sp. JS614]MBI2243006.1 heme exporter protein CcmB [Nocardioides sp.]